MEIKNLDRIGSNSQRRKVLEELPGIFEDLDPGNVCRREGEALREEAENARRTFVVGFGKASYTMYSGIRESLGNRITSAWIIVPEDQDTGSDFPELKVLRGTHPITGSLTEQSTMEIARGLEGLDQDDLVVVLISGGGSALFEEPVQGVSIDDLAEGSKCLMDADANIYELNTFRKLFSRVKGGKFAKILYPAQVRSLVISDVFGDDIGTIASGPLTESKLDSSDLERIVSVYGKKCPAIARISSNAEFPALDRKYYENVRQKIVLKNSDFVHAFARTLGKSGKDCVMLGSDINGDVDMVAEELASMLHYIYILKGRGFWFAFGGETTVNVKGNGQGGRNQELCLRFLRRMKGQNFLLMCIGTDGVDGRSEAMGAIVDSDLRGKVSNDVIDQFLNESDSFTLLNCNGSAIITGRTGNNVSDVALGYYSEGSSKLSQGGKNSD